MSIRIINADVFEGLAQLEDESVHCVVTSPPYWGLRCYGVDGQLGLEPTLGEHIETMVRVFGEVKRVLRKDGTLWLNYGDCYATSANGRSAAATKELGNDDRTFRDKPFSTVGPINKGKRIERGNGRWGGGNNPAGGVLKPKDLCMIPARLAIALQEDGWWIRSEIIWAKPNPMPESIQDRPTSSHEKIYLLSKSPRYFYDAEAVRVPAKYPDDDRIGRASMNHKRAPTEKISGIRPRQDKQRGHSRRHAGFNDCWDQMPREERQSMGANLRNVWNIATKSCSEAHFATFPPALIDPCIKAGTSEKGVCPECGAPWIREIETTLTPTKKAAKTFIVDERDKSADRNDQGSNRQKDGHKSGHVNISKTLGWSPSCECGVPTAFPATMLDPFGGSGTTGLVADRLGRDAILIELNPEYCDLARKRIADDAPLFTEVT
mgnify:CR=1 FL=1